VKLSIESLPSRQLNLRPDTNLIAGKIRDSMIDSVLISRTFGKLDEIWNNPADRKKRLFDYCKTQKDFPLKACSGLLLMWAVDLQQSADSARDFDELSNILKEARQMI
jgi:hypothetical protein